MKALVSKETVVSHQERSEKQELFDIKQVDKGRITNVRRLFALTKG